MGGKNERSIIKDYLNAVIVNAWEMRKLSNTFFAILLMELFKKSNLFKYTLFSSNVKISCMTNSCDLNL